MFWEEKLKQALWIGNGRFETPNRGLVPESVVGNCPGGLSRKAWSRGLTVIVNRVGIISITF